MIRFMIVYDHVVVSDNCCSVPTCGGTSVLCVTRHAEYVKAMLISLLANVKLIFNALKAFRRYLHT